MNFKKLRILFLFISLIKNNFNNIFNEKNFILSTENFYFYEKNFTKDIDLELCIDKCCKNLKNCKDSQDYKDFINAIDKFKKHIVQIVKEKADFREETFILNTKGNCFNTSESFVLKKNEDGKIIKINEDFVLTNKHSVSYKLSFPLRQKIRAFRENYLKVVQEYCFKGNSHLMSFGLPFLMAYIFANAKKKLLNRKN